MKYVLTFVAIFAALPTLCSAEDLSAFGIPSVEVITDAEGDNVRGLGVFARSTSAAGISMNILDPNTGSQWNVFTTAFDTADDAKSGVDSTGETVASNLGAGVQTSGLAALADMTVSVTNDVPNGGETTFGFQTLGIAATASGQANSGMGESFTFGEIVFPTVNFGTP